MPASTRPQPGSTSCATWVARAIVERVRDRRVAGGGSPAAELERETPRNCGVGEFVNIMPNGDVFPCHVLTQSEFRCGNLRHDSLKAICRRTGLLGEPSALDFRALAARDDQLGPLRDRGSYMGSVYPSTKANAIWKKTLPGMKGA
jgi:hypothetical protein